MLGDDDYEPPPMFEGQKWFLLDDDGEPREAPFAEVGLWFATVGNLLLLDEVTENVRVSTVFVGCFGVRGDAMFETMVFAAEKGVTEFEGAIWRTKTRAEAVECHGSVIARIVNELRVN